MTALKHFRSKSEDEKCSQTCKQARINDEFEITVAQVSTIIDILRTIANADEGDTVDIPELTEATPEDMDELRAIATRVFPKEVAPEEPMEPETPVEPEFNPEEPEFNPEEPEFNPEEETFRKKCMQSKKEAQPYTPSFLKLMTTKF